MEENFIHFEETIEAIRYLNEDAQGYRSAIGDSIDNTEISVKETHAKVVCSHEESVEAVERFEKVLPFASNPFIRIFDRISKPNIFIPGEVIR